MGYIKEPNGVDLLVTPHELTEYDQQCIQQAITLYKKTKKVPKNIRVETEKSSHLGKRTG
ncbi:MAG: hypothetical protein K1X91_00425 [Bacteriodetes bacterium]|nr:hypothetical protein [Bacteroidota bacterium]